MRTRKPKYYNNYASKYSPKYFRIVTDACLFLCLWISPELPNNNIMLKEM